MYIGRMNRPFAEGKFDYLALGGYERYYWSELDYKAKLFNSRQDAVDACKTTGAKKWEVVEIPTQEGLYAAD